MRIYFVLVFVYASTEALAQLRPIKIPATIHIECLCVEPGTCDKPPGLHISKTPYKAGIDGCQKDEELCCKRPRPDSPSTPDPPIFSNRPDYPNPPNSPTYPNPPNYPSPSSSPNPLNYTSHIEDTCGMSKPQTNTGRASSGNYLWQVALIQDNKYLVGSGVLIDSRNVLTTAQSIIHYVNSPEKIMVGVGKWVSLNFNEPYTFTQLPVKKINVHPLFDPANLYYDVAVIRLSNEVPAADYANINSVCLPKAVPKVGKTCYVLGWRKVSSITEAPFQSILTFLNVPIVDNNECEARLRRTAELGPTFGLDKFSFICAGGEPDREDCGGDAGGPLVCENDNGQYEIVGLISWLIACTGAGVPDVYTNINRFNTWINTVRRVP